MSWGECVSQAADMRWVDWLQKDAGVKKHKLIRAQTGMVAVNWLGFFSHGANISLGKRWRLKMERQGEPDPRKWQFWIVNKQLCAKVFIFSSLHLERDGHDYWPHVVCNHVIYHGLGMWGWSQTPHSKTPHWSSRWGTHLEDSGRHGPVRNTSNQP